MRHYQDDGGEGVSEMKILEKSLGLPCRGRGYSTMTTPKIFLKLCIWWLPSAPITSCHVYVRTYMSYDGKI